MSQIAIAASGNDVSDLVSSLRALPVDFSAAAVRAVNKTLLSVRAEMVRAVREDYAVKAGAVRQSLRIKRASRTSVEGSVSGSGSPGVPLIEFVRGNKSGPSTKRTGGGGYRPARGISVFIRKDKGKMVAEQVFVQRMASGHVGAFKRRPGNMKSSGTGRPLIEERFGPSPIAILSSDRYHSRIEEYADGVFRSNLEREAARVLRIG